MIEIPPKFAGRPPVSLLQSRQGAKKKELDLDREWPGATGLAEDVRYYGAWMREEAQKRIGHLYPPVEITAEMAKERPDLKPLVGQKLTVIAWLWARTVKSPNPAFSHVDVPLASNFILFSREGREAYVQPVVEGDQYRFTVTMGTPPQEAENGTKLGRGANFRCLMSNTAIDQKHIREAFVGKRAGQRLMAIVAEGARGRVYLAPTSEMEAAASSAEPAWRPEVEMNQDSKDLLSGRGYGFKYWHELFTPRQLVALTTFSDLVAEARERIRLDASASGLLAADSSLEAGGTAATAYAEAVSVFLAFAASKSATFLNTLSRWRAGEGKTAPAFGRQAIAMVWDYADVNPFAGAGGDFLGIVEGNAKAVAGFDPRVQGAATQADARSQKVSFQKRVSTDPLLRQYCLR